MIRIQMLLGILVFSALFARAQEKPRVFVFTDINIDSGDPDDRQSLVHLFWYANELDIEGIVPERWNARSYEACELALEAYAEDFMKSGLAGLIYPPPSEIDRLIAADMEQGKELFHRAASNGDSPLYVLIWGNMKGFRDALFENPEMADNLRVLSIGTGLMLEKDIPHLPDDWDKSEPCKQMNWNAAGRNDIFHDERFRNMWWIESNWTYNGMFSGPEPSAMLRKLSAFGAMGQHLKDVVKNEEWAQYFRVGDTPSVLYVIDPGHDPDRPEESSWAGRFVKPFPQTRPNYYTDYSDDLGWEYADPCASWSIHEAVKDTASATLEERRNEMYEALLSKLSLVYKLK